MNEIEQLEQAITILEAQRARLGDAVVDAAIGPMREKLVSLEPSHRAEQRKLVTVLFADLVGWTKMAEQMDPEDVQAIQRAYFAAVTPAIEQHGGAVEKYIGDAVLAVFGVPQAHEDDPERAIRTALAMQEAIVSLNNSLVTSVVLTSYPPSLSLRIGIHTGLVVSSVDADGNFVVTGDTVNLASRLESAAAPSTVLISAETQKLVAHAFELDAVEAVQAKGKAELIPAFQVLSAKMQAAKRRGIAGLDSPLVGRETEFTALQHALNRLQSGIGGVITIVGEAGIGKSRLVAELRKSQKATALRSPTSVLWIEGRCLSFGVTIPYLLWLDVLRSALGMTLDGLPDIVKERLQKWVHNLCPNQFDAVYPYLARLLSLPLEAEMLVELAELDGQTLKHRTFEAVETAISCTANQTPLVLVCEDLHWADPSSLELLRYLLQRLADTSALFVCVSRIRKDHDVWKLFDEIRQTFSEQHIALLLKPLSPVSSDILVTNLLHGDALPPALQERILGKAEGNPFFVEEVIRSLIDLDTIEYDTANGIWTAKQDIEAISIPDTLQGVLTARIDRLQADTRHILQLASVIGRIFLYRVLAALAEEEHQLENKLSVLQREELIRERARLPELEFIFKHALTQEATYNGILKRRRRVFHRQVAEALERLFPDRIDEMLGVLAHHWEQTQESDRAVWCLLRAGDFASMAYAHQEAIEFYERALALLRLAGEQDRAARTLLKLGQAYHDAFCFEQAQIVYQDAFDLWEQRVETVVPPAPHALRIWMKEPLTLDLTLRNDILPYVSLLFTGLTRRTLDGEAVPAMARSWEILDGGCSYVFQIRRGVYWSDGVPVTAHDFEYAWKRMLRPDIHAHVANLLYDIVGAEAFHRGELMDPDEVGVRADGDHLLAVRLVTPVAYFLKLLSHESTFPIPRHQVETKESDWAKPEHLVSNGPFRLKTWLPGATMVLVRRPDGYDPYRGNVQRLEFYHDIDDWTSAWGMYQEDRIHHLDLLFAFSKQFQDGATSHADQHHQVDQPLTWFLTFNAQQPPFDDLRVRRALAHAINKDDLIKALSNLHLPAKGGFIPPGVPGHALGIGLAFDLGLARRLMRDAGYGLDLKFPHVRLSVSFDLLALANQLAEQWHAALGISSTVVPTRDPSWESNCGAYVNGWNADVPDPDNFLRVVASNFRVMFHWRDDTYERLVQSGRQINDQFKRIQLYQEADRRLIDAAILIPLIYHQRHWLAKPWITMPKGTTSAGRFSQYIIEPH